MSNIFQFKITLEQSDPKIWRRIQVDDTMTFHDLHLVLQITMGWTNSHLYQFKYKNKLFIGVPQFLDGMEARNSMVLKLSNIFEKPKDKILYEYDFGDSWIHELCLEKILLKDKSKKYPACIEGEMNCPPEDCGGVYGFNDYMKILEDKNHPEYDDILEWMGEDYDPKEFDQSAINKLLKKYKKIEIEFDTLETS